MQGLEAIWYTLLLLVCTMKIKLYFTECEEIRQTKAGWKHFTVYNCSRLEALSTALVRQVKVKGARNQNENGEDLHASEDRQK